MKSHPAKRPCLELVMEQRLELKGTPILAKDFTGVRRLFEQVSGAQFNAVVLVKK